MAIKVAGIHWWYKSRSHAAEMTAGYYNFLARDGYKPIAQMLRKRGVGLSFTCIEMSDEENPDARHSSPEREPLTLPAEMTQRLCCCCVWQHVMPLTASRCPTIARLTRCQNKSQQLTALLHMSYPQNLLAIPDLGFLVMTAICVGIAMMQAALKEPHAFSACLLTCGNCVCRACHAGHQCC